MPLAILPEPEPNIESEPEALARYQRHTAECLECDAGRSRDCHVGRVLHNRWAALDAAQRGSTE